MKEVIIKISSCKNCTNCTGTEKGFFCRHLKQYIDENRIPYNCPLPDMASIKKQLFPTKGPVKDEWLI